MKKANTTTSFETFGNMEFSPQDLRVEAQQKLSASFEKLCLTAGLEALSEMLECDAETACGPRHGRSEARRAHRWGKTKGKIGFHGGMVEIERPRVRGFNGKEHVLPTWKEAMRTDMLGNWALNQMLINVSTRKFGRSVRLPEGDITAGRGAGISKSAVSRRFVALSSAKLKEFMSSDLSKLDLLVIQIDGLHLSEDLMTVGAIGVDGNGDKHPLGLVMARTRSSITDPFVPLILETLEKYPTLTASRLHAMARERGYTGGVSHFRYVVSLHWPRPPAEAYLRLRTLPGEQMQCDWALCRDRHRAQWTNPLRGREPAVNARYLSRAQLVSETLGPLV